MLAVIAALCAAANAETTPRASAAKNPLPGSPKAEWVQVEARDGRKLLTAVLRPEGTGPFPAVVLLHGGDGLDYGYLSAAEDIARAGFVVVAGCWQKVNYVCADAPTPSEWVGDPTGHCGKELIEIARTLEGVKSDKIALYGISRGGHAALWAASTGSEVSAIVVDAPAHEPSAYNIYPPPPRPIRVLAGLKAPVLLMHGTNDDVISVDQSREYEKAARELGKAIEVVYVDGGGHMVSKSNAALRDRAVTFLQQYLK